QLQEKAFAITTLKSELRKLKGKNVVNTAVSKPNAILAPGMFKLKIEAISPRLKNNRDAHVIYIKKTIEYADTLYGFVERARTQYPSKPLLESACMLTKHVQELLVYASQTCPNSPKPSEKLVAVTPTNKDKRVRFAEPDTSSNNIPIQTDSLKTKDSNKPLLNSTGVKLTTSASRSKPSGNTKNNRISRPPRRFFTIVGSSCPLTRITPKKILHLKETTPKDPMLQMFHLLLLFSMTGCPDRPLVSGLQMFKTYDREPLSAHELRSCDTNLYTISLDDMLKTSPICLLSKASKTNSWLWHRRLSHLNFACALGKSKKSSHQPKAKETNQEKLYLLHMDLCGPMHVESINRKKYILVIIDDYSRFTWVEFLRSKDEAPDAIIKCIKKIKVHLNATIHKVRTDNGTEFVNQTLHDFYENVSISHQTSVARTPQQKDVVERRNQTLVEAARTMLIFSKAPLFLWTEAINTACYTQKRSLIRLRYNKTSYELMHNKKPDLSFFYVFGSLCYPTNDNEDLGKLNTKANIVDDAPKAMEIADSPVSTSIGQDAPSSSIPSTQDQEHSLIISQGVEESPKTPLFHDDPLHKFLHEDSTSL
ncbi:retrovirus-related pol polyprotein from transposon TNT 1-94, partial [Tanacetum coccineum]